MAVSNLDEQGRRRRRTSGIIGAVAALLLTVAVLWIPGTDVPGTDGFDLARLIVFPFYYLAASGFLQARTRTCVARARRGEREEAGCGIRIDNEETAAQLRAAARKIQVQSFIVAAVATAVVYFLPVRTDLRELEGALHRIMAFAYMGEAGPLLAHVL